MLNYIFSYNLISDYSDWILYSFPIAPVLHGNAKKWAGLMPLILYLLSREPSRSNS